MFRWLIHASVLVSCCIVRKVLPVNMFKYVFFVIVGLAGSLMLSPSFAQASEFKSGSLTINQPWARPTIGKAPNSAAYLKITNHGGAPDTLIGVKSDVAKRVELHTVKKDGDIMKMRAVKDGITVAAHKSVELKPGGYHIMLIGLSRKLNDGDIFELSLQFKMQGEVPVKVKIQKMGSMDSGAMKGDHDHGAHGHGKHS
jgi:copper(I)-binding protein